MSEETDEQGQGDVPDDPAGLRQALRDQGKTNADLRAENDALRKDAAFRDAGIPSDGAGKYFRKGYEGDLDSETIRATALADGIVSDTPDPKPEAPVKPQVPQDELDAIDRMNVSGEDVGNEEGSDLESRIRGAGSREELQGVVRQAGLSAPQ
ncbi:MAG: hypothetical protein GY679_00820 [Mycoplasma sp.]|nr:hypothetical protein [Mycoplasma sp.]